MLVVDSREHHLHSILESLGISFENKTLDIGDIDICGKTGQRFLFERKTIEDLASSLRDGRFKEQKDRLIGVLQREPLTAVAYILEGKIDYGSEFVINGSVKMSMITSLIHTIQLRYRIPIVYTTNVRDTGLYIQSVLKKMENDPDFSPVGDGKNAGCFEHTSLLPKISSNRKTDGVSILTTMLTAIPGVSHTISTGILQWFIENTGGFIEFIRSKSKEEFQTAISQVKVNGRCISRKIQEAITSVFYETTIPSVEPPVEPSVELPVLPDISRKPSVRRNTKKVDLDKPLFMD